MGNRTANNFMISTLVADKQCAGILARQALNQLCVEPTDSASCWLKFVPGLNHDNMGLSSLHRGCQSQRFD
jgi:hypothetical protein